jgi:hypothetical protein
MSKNHILDPRDLIKDFRGFAAPIMDHHYIIEHGLIAEEIQAHQKRDRSDERKATWVFRPIA